MPYIETGKPYRHDKGYHRIDQYQRPDGSIVPDRMLCAGPRDTSPVYNGQYDTRCSCCWLGFGHTETKHTESVIQWDADSK